jgi:hypothetical protein
MAWLDQRHSWFCRVVDPEETDTPERVTDADVFVID